LRRALFGGRMSTLIFWVATFLLLHSYFFYAMLLVAFDAVDQLMRNIRHIRGGADRAGCSEQPFLPPVTVVVAAYNEVSCIAQKVANTLEIDYPRERLQLLVGSDGSTDGTDELVRKARDSRVVLSRAERAGKTTVLNRCIPAAAGEIVVLTDANTLIEPSAVKQLVRHFRDPEVGAVCGRLRLYNPTVKEYEESAYWSYESLLKLYEGKRGAVMGANGGIYAIRRSLFSALPPSTIVDDFVIPLQILDRGYKVLYEPEALASEETTEDYRKEFGRRARIAAGNFQSLRLVPGLLLPTAGFAAFAFWSHKLLRWCAPGLMAVALVANAFLFEQLLYKITLVSQLGFYALALAGRYSVFRGLPKRAASVAYYFVTMNLAIVVGFWRFLRSSQQAAWDRTARVN
jgi:cellulose synthase/poly-beta-1,6-N-acetylglucosamine synthase-like glycosyltransferase